MSRIKTWTDPTVTVSSPALPVPDKATLVSTVKKTLDGDTNLLASQLGAGTFFIKCSLEPHSSGTTLPGMNVEYSYATEAGTTTNTVTGKTSQAIGKTISQSVEFVSVYRL
jgi:hypothetical protein